MPDLEAALASVRDDLDAVDRRLEDLDRQRADLERQHEELFTAIRVMERLSSLAARCSPADDSATEVPLTQRLLDTIVDDDAVWVLPPDRMKARRQHRVPLSAQALEILRAARALAPTSRYVFPVRRRDGSLCCVRPAPVTRLLRQLELVDEQQRPVVMHGFRATFRVWAMEAEASFEVCEAALAHVQSDQTVSAYARSRSFRASPTPDAAVG